MTKAVDDSTQSNKKAIDEVKTIVSDAKVFLESLQAEAETNATKVNNTIDSLSKSLQAEKENFDQVCSSLQTDHASLQTSIDSRLKKLQADLATENKLWMSSLVTQH